MGIKKYFASKDTTITNAFDSFISARKTSSNMGASDILESFVLYDRDGSGSVAQNELSRILVYFNHASIASDISSGLFDVNNARFMLKLYNAAHGETLPRNFTLQVMPVIRDWDEGEGLDMENYTDEGGACWLRAKDSVTWATAGGDYTSMTLYTQNFVGGQEDLEIDITTLVNEWLDGDRNNYGLIIKMSAEDAALNYYTKRFFGRKSHYFFHRPIIEVQYEEDSDKFSKDHRNESDGRDNFYFSSPLASTADNTNTLYMYNFVRGQLKDIPGYGSGGNSLYVKIYNDERTLSLSGDTRIQASWERTGVYSVDVVLSGSSDDYPTIHDCWYLTSTSADPIWVGDITTKSITNEVPDYSVSNTYETMYVIKVKDLKTTYRNDDVVKFRLFSRKKDWTPNLYLTYWADHADTKEIVENLYYKIYRPADNFTVVDYSYDESIDYSHVCYDDVSNYFVFDMSTLEPDFAYCIKFAYKYGDNYIESEDEFKFRVSDVGLWTSLEA